MMDIFCPTCQELILEADACPACNWRRHVIASEVGELAWTADLGVRLNKPHCYPVVAGQHYCLGAEDGTLLALDVLTGQVVWEHPLPAETMAHALATDGARLFVGMEDKRPLPIPGKEVLALDAQTGEVAWHLETPAHSTSAVAVAGGLACFTVSGGQLYAVDAVTGQTRWMVEHPHWSPAPPGLGDGVVCAGGRAPTLLAYAADDGRQLWRFESKGWFSSSLFIAGGRVFALAWDDYLYALELSSGALLWKFRGERGRGITSPIAVSESCVFIGSRVNPGGYALLALDAATGAERWRLAVDKHILTPPRAIDNMVFFASGGHDGHFYAVDAATGAEQWHVPAPSQVVTQPCVAGDLVIFGGRDGLLHAARWQQPPQEEILTPEAYVQAEAYEKAAAAYALNGAFAAAADLYHHRLEQLPQAIKLYEHAGMAEHAAQLWEQLGDLKQAAQRYEQGGQVNQAAELWERQGDLRRARDLYQEADNQVGLAAVLEKLGEHLDAARIYAASGNYREAARLYQRGGDRSSEADMYVKVGEYTRAAQIWRDLNEWQKQVETLVVYEKNLLEGARILEEHDQLERAADLYEQMEAFEQALRIYIKLENWEQVAQLARRVENYEQEARAWEHLGEHQQAVQACVLAAQKLLGQLPMDEAHIARLYEDAARLYGQELFDEGNASACQRMVRKYRHLPELAVTVKAEGEFIENEYNTLTLTLINQGFGIARNIHIQIQGTFDVVGECVALGLRPGAEKPIDVQVRPHKGHYGPSVPLGIQIEYEDRQGTPYPPIQYTTTIAVSREGGLLGALSSATPLNITIQELYQHSKKIGGDEVHGQKGDKVEINRGSGVTADSGVEGDRVVMRAGAAAVRRCPICNVPTTDPEQHYCSDCGAPLP